MIDVCAFATTAKNGCGALAVRRCEQSKCRFYKTSEQAKEAKEKVYKRLRGLPHEQQLSISEKHYGGKMPWAIN